MLKSSLIVSFCLVFLLIEKIDSTYHVYTFSDGPNAEEHCCLVRFREKFCFATPVTRSLIQVDRNCHKLQRNKFSKKQQRLAHLDKIHRRLDVQSIRENQDFLLIELRRPLESSIVKNDLVCLSSNEKKINFRKCFVELAAAPEKLQRQKKTTDEVIEVFNEKTAEKNRVELNREIYVRESEGLGLKKVYRLNISNVKFENRDEQRCVSMLKNVFRNAERRDKAICVEMNDPRERCFEQFSNVAENNEQFMTIGSKLFCENSREKFQLLGIQQRTKVCFYSTNFITVEHIFSEFGQFSNQQRREEIIRSIESKEKLRMEFENDCFDMATLVEEKHRERKL